MTPSTALVEMRVPVSCGQFLTVIFDPAGDVDFAPLRNWNGARTAQRPAPLFLKPLKENGAGAPLLHSAPLPAHEWRKPSPSGEFLGDIPTPQKTAREELEETRSAVAELASEMADLDAQLRPVRAEEDEIKSRISSTHRRSGNLVVLDLSRRDEREPLFRRLDAISRKWGRVKGDRARLSTQIRSLEREIVQLEKRVVKENRKRGTA